MGDVLQRKTLGLRRSVNTPDYDPVEWIINPDLSPVEAVPHKYWKIDGDRVIGMSPEEKTAVDRADLEVLKAAKLEEFQNEMLSRLARTDADYLAAAEAVEAARTEAEVEAVRLK